MMHKYYHLGYLLTLSITSTRYTVQSDSTRYKKQGFTHCQVVLPRRHLHIFGPGRSVMLPEVVNRGQVCIITRRRYLQKCTIKRVLWYVRWLTTLKSVGSVLTHARIPLPHWRQSHQSHSDAVEIPLGKLDCISCQRSAARRSIGANPEDDDTPTVT